MAPAQSEDTKNHLQTDDEMKDREINVEIAITQGWQPKEMAPNGERWLFWRTRKNMIIESQLEPPNYCTDLNAMHEAEKTLKGMELYEYIAQLFDLCYEATIATARQRAEAFLRTLGKWEEAK